jgi:hypothetical protein
MAHRSRKKHIKHLHQQEAATPKAKSPARAKSATKARASTKAGPAKAGSAKAGPAKATRARKASAGAASKRSGGVVRSIARAATKKLTARPRRILSKAKSRVKSLIGRDAS